MDWHWHCLAPPPVSRINQINQSVKLTICIYSTCFTAFFSPCFSLFLSDEIISFSLSVSVSVSSSSSLELETTYFYMYCLQVALSDETKCWIIKMSHFLHTQHYPSAYINIYICYIYMLYIYIYNIYIIHIYIYIT